MFSKFNMNYKVIKLFAIGRLFAFRDGIVLNGYLC